MVDLVKLKYFQNRFIRDLISGAVADPVALSNRILKPIQTELQQFDEKISAHQGRKDVTIGMDDHDSIGRLTMRRIHERTEDYIHQVLKAWKGPIDDHAQFIRENLYAFWAPSKAAYRESFTELQDGMRRVLLHKETKNIENADISKVLLYFKNCLAEIPEDQWVSEAVGNTAKGLADAVEYYDIKKDQVMSHGAGWKFLRWGLFNGMSGQSVVPMMLLLGREESLKRLREARKVVVQLEEDAATAAREKEEELKRSKVRITYTGNPLREDPDKAQQAGLAEPRNVKVPIKEEEEEELPPSKTEHFLRPLHESRSGEGPYASKVPNRSYTLDASPPVQFLEPEDFKAGYRHLLNSDTGKDAEQYAPPLWKVAENRKQAVLARTQEAAAVPVQPEGPGPFRVSGLDEDSSRRPGSTLGEGPGSQPPPRPPYSADRPFPPEGPGPMMRPMHPEDGPEPKGPDGPVATTERGPFAAGEPIKDLKAHVEHIRKLNMERTVRSDKRLRRDRLKQVRTDFGLKPLGGLPMDLRDSGNGPFWAGEVAYHPLRPQVKLRPHLQDAAAEARAADVAHDERRAQQGVEKKENGSEDKVAKELRRAWYEARDQ